MSEKISLDSTGAKVWREPAYPSSADQQQPLTARLKHFAHAHHVRMPRFLIYVKLFWQPIANGYNKRPHTDRPHAFGRYEMIKRITDTRKLVTGLSRLLHGKHAVVGRMRKRAKVLDFEGVEAYIGDLEGGSLACLPPRMRADSVTQTISCSWRNHSVTKNTYCRTVNPPTSLISTSPFPTFALSVIGSCWV